MKVSRRQFIKLAAATGVGLALPGKLAANPQAAWAANPWSMRAFYQSPGNRLQKFVQPLRGVGPGGIPLATSDGTSAVTGATHYSLSVQQYLDTLHPTLGPTTLWGYVPTGTATPHHLGGIIVAQKGTPVQLTVTNMLPPQHILPVDRSSIFPDAASNYGNPTPAANAITTHLHGGLVPWISDGGPMTWFDPNGHYGPSAQFGSTNIYKLLNPGLLPGQGEYYYPNNQSARLVWYHDHAHDITRLNAYAGIATAYVIRDSFEGRLRNLGLPDFVENGGREIPIVIQDKIFVGPNIAKGDPTWPGPTGVGSLWYPHIYETDRWERDPQPLYALPDPSCVPEMFGDTMLANGTVYPEATVEARRYRLRILNACQARFLNLQLYVDDGSRDGITLNASFNPTNRPGPTYMVIGTEGGFLSHPVNIASNVPFSAQNDADGNPIPATIHASLLTAPAMRWDIIIDFTGYAGQKLILYNDAPAPFPMGDQRNDYFPGAPDNPTQPTPGFGPNTRQIMRFNVVPATSRDSTLHIDTSTNLTPGIDPSLVGMWTTNPLPPPPGVKVRQLTLNEDYDAWGRLIQREGTDLRTASLMPSDPPTNGMAYMDTPTETPKAGATEVWQIANLTGDTHPIHFHLVNVQVLSRQPFTSYNYGKKVGKAGAPAGLGATRGPEMVELGWKETVLMHPNEITTVIMRFDLPTGLPFSVPSSPMTGGNEYVWHCHILDHEEHDMMRPLVVT